MAQDDFSVANAAGATVRADINANLQALATLSSGAAAPSTTYAYQYWADTTTGLLKIRNAANSAWITVGMLSNLADFTTGDVKITLKTTADTGWVLMNDGTIGNAASGGTTRANADTVDLFTLLWNNTADAQCAVSTGRGANAAADYAANKTIALPKALGRALATYGAGSGLTSRALALTTGVETHPLVTGEMPAHTHPQSTNTFNVDAGAFAYQVTAGGGNTLGGTTGSTGSGTAHQNMQPSLFLNTMIKL